MFANVRVDNLSFNKFPHTVFAVLSLRSLISHMFTRPNSRDFLLTCPNSRHLLLARPDSRNFMSPGINTSRALS